MINEIDYEDSDFVQFEPEDDEEVKKPALPFYKILIVDDEEEVHKVTKLILRDRIFDGHGMMFLSAYSLEDAKKVFHVHDDIAIVLIDVVMETNTAGLDLVKYIRDILKNRTTRIILRTGQPGSAPEDEVIIDYDINDYKSKDELTSQKLFTSVIACIRGYRDIIMIDRNRNGLRQIIDSTTQLFDFQDKSIQEFLDDLLGQLISFHTLCGGSGKVEGFVMVRDESDLNVISATEGYESYLKQPVQKLRGSTVLDVVPVVDSDCQDEIVFSDGHYHCRHMGYEDTVSTIHIQYGNGIEQDLIRIFLSNIIQALDNYILNRNIQISEREIISTLSEVVEKRDLSTAHHIKRVSEYAFIMSKNVGLDNEMCKKIKIACMMHDVGKIGVCDQILLKPSILNAEEFEKIKEHSKIGHCILENSSMPIMKIAAEIALSHHERWDGTGYPNRLKELSIPLNARIISVLDVFDALTHKRIYKEPWSLEESFDYIRSQSGKMFDPRLVDLFFDSMDEILKIWYEYPDETDDMQSAGFIV